MGSLPKFMGCVCMLVAFGSCSSGLQQATGDYELTATIIVPDNIGSTEPTATIVFDASDEKQSGTWASWVAGKVATLFSHCIVCPV